MVEDQGDGEDASSETSRSEQEQIDDEAMLHKLAGQMRAQGVPESPAATARNTGAWSSASEEEDWLSSPSCLTSVRAFSSHVNITQGIANYAAHVEPKKVLVETPSPNMF